MAPKLSSRPRSYTCYVKWVSHDIATMSIKGRLAALQKYRRLGLWTLYKHILWEKPELPFGPMPPPVIALKNKEMPPPVIALKNMEKKKKKTICVIKAFGKPCNCLNEKL